MKKVISLIFSFILSVAVVLTASVPSFAYPVKDIPKMMSSGNRALSSEEIQILYSMFDAKYYAEQNPDVVKVVGRGKSKLFEHFCTYGLYELRQPDKDFNVVAYAFAYDDLSEAFGPDVLLYYKHYYEFGKKEQRILTTMEALAATGVNVELLKKMQSTVADGNAGPQPEFDYEEEEEEVVTPDVRPCKHTKYVFVDAEHHKCANCGKLSEHYGWASVTDLMHKCAGCSGAVTHEYVGGVCAVCNHKCEHNGQKSGERCIYCGEIVPVPPCTNLANHESLHQGQKCPDCDYLGEKEHTWNATTGKCSVCEAKCTHPGYSNGTCTVCDTKCPKCGGEGLPGTNGCDTCGKVKVNNCLVDHSMLCIGQTCECGEQGTGAHSWYADGEDEHKCSKCFTSASHTFTEQDYDYHKCADCGRTETHTYISQDDQYHKCADCDRTEDHSYEVDWICNLCEHACGHFGATIGEDCPYCGKELHDCTLQGHEYNIHYQCVYCGGYKCRLGGMEHDWDSTKGRCNICNDRCPTCDTEGSESGCPTCGKKKITYTNVCTDNNHDWEMKDWGCHRCKVCGLEEEHEFISVNNDIHKCKACGGAEEEHDRYLVDKNYHKCQYCNEAQKPHDWDDGYCWECLSYCPVCDGNGKKEGCPNCHYVSE